VSIDDVKVGAWCAMSASRITGPIFPEAIHSHLYVHTEMIVDLQFRILVFPQTVNSLCNL